MTHYVGLDVSLRETAICMVDSSRNVIKEGKVPSEGAEIAAFLRATELDLALIASRPARWRRRCTMDWSKRDCRWSASTPGT